MSLLNRAKKAIHQLGKKAESPQTQTTQFPEAAALIEAYGGQENITSLGACITRLRIRVVETQQVQQEQLKQLGARGVISLPNEVQAVFGEDSLQLMQQMESLLTTSTEIRSEPNETEPEALPPPAIDEEALAIQQTVEQCICLFGGIGNIASVQHYANSRVRLALIHDWEIDTESVKIANIQAIMPISLRLYHLISLEQAKTIAGQMAEKTTTG